MKVKNGFSFWGTVFLLLNMLSVGAVKGQPIPQASLAPIPPGTTVVGVQFPNSANAAVSYKFLFLHQSVWLWADGKGNAVFEQYVTNTSANASDVLSSLTWGFNYPSNDYQDVQAVDSAGQLHIDPSTSSNGDQLYTVVFRNPVKQNQTYYFKLYITIGQMTQGSGDNWAVNWSTIVNPSITSFLEDIYVPANASITSITPAPSERRKNVVSWNSQVQSNYTLKINMPYVLSNTNDVPLVLQTSEPWGSLLYAYNTEQPYNIANYGCYMTSGVMLMNYLAQTQSSGLQTNPLMVNSYMVQSKGYDQYNGVNPVFLATYARKYMNVSMYYKTASYKPDNELLDYYLRSGYPVILGVDRKYDAEGKPYMGHWVLATGKITLPDGSTTYAINDPYYGKTTLQKQHPDGYYEMRLFAAADSNQQIAEFVVLSPVEFVVVDPLGRRTGFDPTTNTMLNEIPDASYLYEAIAPETGSGKVSFHKSLTIPNAMKGSYHVILYGTGDGPYTFQSYGLDYQSTLVENTWTGSITTGQVINMDVPYTDAVRFISYLPLLRR